jgi:hypothetical protein
MWKTGSSFADVVAKNNKSCVSHKFMKKTNETTSMYISRIKKEILSNTVKGPFKVFIVSRDRVTFKIAARNEYVAKCYAIMIVQKNDIKSEKKDEQLYVDFAISDFDEGYKIGIHEDMSSEEASHIAQLFYRSMYSPINTTAMDWINATVVRSIELRDVEGHVFA